MGITVKALIGVIIALNRQIAALEEEISESFDQHPDATIVRSLPPVGGNAVCTRTGSVLRAWVGSFRCG
jgi:hypothetical protein